MQITQRPAPPGNFTLNRLGTIPDHISLHTTGNTKQSGINTVLNPSSGVSYHFIIGRDGSITQLVEIRNTAHSNGTTSDRNNDRWHGHSPLAEIRTRNINANRYTISIGFGDMTNSNPSPEHLRSAVWLINHIRNEVRNLYGINIPFTRERIIGHDEVTPRTRWFCPGIGFPWDELMVMLWDNDREKEWEGEEMTQEQFNKMFQAAISEWMANRGTLPPSDWAKAELEKAKELGISDGKRPRSFATREEVMAVVVRAGGRNML